MMLGLGGGGWRRWRVTVADGRGWTRMDVDGRGWSRMVADGTWMAVDGADGCGWTRMVRMVVAVACDYQVECKEEKKILT